MFRTFNQFLFYHRTVTLEIPGIHTTWCMEIVCKVKGRDGEPVERVIHNTVHRLGD